MVTQKIVCDNCGVEQKEHVYFIISSIHQFLASLGVPELPDESAIIRHACGDRCLMNMLSEWAINWKQKRVTSSNDNDGINFEAKSGS